MNPQTTVLDRQGKRLLVLMVIVGYIVTFAFIAVQERKASSEEIFWGILFGVIYTIVALNDR